MAFAAAYALESVPAIRHQGLSSTYLTDYKKGEHLIMSDIHTGTPGKDAVIRHMLQVKVETFGKAYSSTYESPDKKSKESLTVTLTETDDPQELEAQFEHAVRVGGNLTLKFCGITRVRRVN